MITLTGLAVIVMMLKLSRVFFGTYFSPITVHSTLWAVILFLFSLDPFFDYVSVSTEAWQLICFSQITFLLGCLPLRMLRAKSSTATHRDLGSSLHRFERPLTRSVICFACIGALGILTKWFILLRLFGNPKNIITNLGNLRLEYLGGLFAFPVWTDFLTFFLFPALLFVGILMPIGLRYRLWAGCLLGLLLLNDMSIAARGTTMHGFLLLINAYLLSLLSDPRFKLNRLLSWQWISSVLALVVLLTSLASIWFIRERLPEITDFLSFLRVSWKSWYLYSTGEIPAFSEILKSEPASTGFGSYSLGGIYRLGNIALGLIGVNPVFPQMPFRPYVFIPQAFNSYPYNWYFYADFGILGILFIPYILGWISSLVFRHYRASQRLVTLVLLTLIFVYLEITPRDTITNWISFWFELAVALCCAIYIETRHRVKFRLWSRVAQSLEETSV